MINETSFFSSVIECIITQATTEDILYLDEQRAKLYAFYQMLQSFKYAPASAFKTLESKDLIDSGCFFYVAHINNIRVGYAEACLGDFPQIKEIWVDPSYRRQGVAKRLIDTCKSWFSAQCEKYMISTVYAGDEASLQMYLAGGWKCISARYTAKSSTLKIDTSLQAAKKLSADEASMLCANRGWPHSELHNYYTYNDSIMFVTDFSPVLFAQAYGDSKNISHLMRTIQNITAIDSDIKEVDLVASSLMDLTEYGYICYQYKFFQKL